MSRNSDVVNAMRSSARSSYASSSMSKAPSKAQLKTNKSEEDHESHHAEDQGSCRDTPMSLRQPSIIYHDEVKDIRSSVVGVLKKNREENAPDTGRSTPSAKDIIKQILEKQKTGNDRYSLVPVVKRTNPFMTKITSEKFQPSMGVTHRDRANDTNSPQVSGGQWKHPNKNVLSRKEFDFRRSLQTLKDVGP